MITGVHVVSVASAASSSAPVSVAQIAGNRAASPGAEDSPFSNLMISAIGKVSQMEDQARTAVDGLISGSGVDVHQAMIATEKASMAFEMALALRNKAIQSYQSVMGMQF
ncbi:flagellar hook-basal body complex protein FliE [Telmatobacter sp. DSM 110680]|uniref:Flagellar hook-basal body complex protein FliE n=1 Tax=Telmatobacter sp. DSM 110680 TaxID=3036704 RepID=A0AAU7DE68_9BACT